MRDKPRKDLPAVFNSAPEWLKTLGVWGWLLAGALGLFAAFLYVFGLTSSVMIPLIVAGVLGALFAPLVDWLEKRSVPRAMGSSVVLLLLLGIAVGTVWITVAGVINQGALIAEQVTAGFASLEIWLQGLNIPSVTSKQLVEQATGAGQQIAAGIGGYLGRGISGTLAFLFGTFLGAFMLFFILKDWHAIVDWVARHLGFPREVGSGIIEDGVHAMQQYFIGVTITGLVVGVMVGVSVWLLGLPLVAAITVVTWLTCYVPYVGAIISSLFAVLVALGSGGIVKAGIVLVIILVAQNVVQTIIQNQIASERLSIHPLAALLGTILGGIFLGLTGAMLAPALVAFGLKALRRVRRYNQEGVEPDTAAAISTP